MIAFKYEKDKDLFFKLHPLVIMIAMDAIHYAKEVFKLDLVITQTVSTEEIDQELGRVSNSHRTLRAIDFRTSNLTDMQVKELINYINNKPEYLKFHYVSNSGERRLMYYHTHTAPHIHLAIHSRYSLDSN